jgi:hypothetical protein
MFCDRLSPQSSSSDTPKRSLTVSWILEIETSANSPCGKTSFKTSWASSTVIGRPVSDEKAITRVSAPSSSRMFVEMRDAMKVRTSLSVTVIPSVLTFLLRIAMRVSRSGGWMSVISPHSNRDRRRSSSVAMSRGGRSLDSTICDPDS